MREMFITVEGIDGSGKSTQAKILKDNIEKTGLKVLLTREPGGSSIGGIIRKALLTKKMDSLTEFLLFASDRNEHIESIILPSIHNGTVVISDRFTDSSLAYQGYGRGVEIKFINSVHNTITKGLSPDISFLIDISPQISIERMKVMQLDRIEQEGMEFLKRVRKGYLEIARKESRFVVIDGLKSVDSIANQMFATYLARRKQWIKEKS